MMSEVCCSNAVLFVACQS